MVTLLLFLFLSVQSISVTDKYAVNSGLATGKAMVELLEKGNFDESLTQFGKGIGPYLGALVPFVGLIMALIPSESSQLALIKNMMKEIDYKLNEIVNRIDDIEREIQKNGLQCNYGGLEQNIKKASQRFQDIYSDNTHGVSEEKKKKARENRKKFYIDSYHSLYHDSGLELYNRIVKQHAFSTDFGTSVLSYTQNDLRKTQSFLLRVMALLLKAAKVEVGYWLLINDSYNAESTKDTWQKRTQSVQRRFEEIKRKCVANYQSESGKDIDRYSSKFKTQTNRQFAYGLITQLHGKYYWRDWYVIAYNPIYGGDNHWVMVKGGHIKFRKNGKNIVVASRDKSHSFMDLYSAEQEMKTVRVSSYRSATWGAYYTVPRPAKDIYNSLDNGRASLVSVIRSDANAAYFSYASTSKSKLISRGSYKLVMWG